jgi:CheY-like chemotaxis protein
MGRHLGAAPGIEHDRRVRRAWGAGMAGPLVLVIDDDMRLVGLLRTALGVAGYQVTAARHGNAAAAGGFLHPALILLDVPPLDSGSAIVTRQLRADPRTAAIPIIALAAKAEPGQHPGLLADELLRKPFLLSELCAAMARWAKPGR